MTLRCRPGDLAIIIAGHPAHPDTAGVLVDVIERAPNAYSFRLPDGTQSAGGPWSWVIKFHRPKRILWIDGSRRLCVFACCPDAYLRPIRDPGPDAVDETLLDLEVAA